MATESLIVEIGANVDKLQRELNKAKQQLDDIDEKGGKAGGALDKMGEVGGKALTAVATAATAAAGAVAIAVVRAQELANELLIASQRSGETVENLQSWAYATETVGVSLEKLGDMAKDTREKVGQFLADGTGGFEDFINVMGLSEEQALETARQFENMSGTDVLQEMVRQMDEAGISTAQMSFALEGMASDTTDLIPLLENGAEKLGDLRDRFTEVGVVLTELDIDRLKALDQNINDVGVAFDGVSGKVASLLSEDLGESNEVITDLIKDIGGAVIWLQSAIKTTSIAVIGGVDQMVIQSRIKLLELQILLEETLGEEAMQSLAGGFGLALEALGLRDTGETFASIARGSASATEQIAQLNQQLEISASVTTDMMDEAMQAWTERMEEYRASTEGAVEAQRALTEAQVEGAEAGTEAIETVVDAVSDSADAAEDEAESVDKNERGKARAKERFASDAMKVNEVLFNDNKAINAGLIVAETAQNVVTSVKNSGGVPWGLPAGAAALAMGVAQLQALKSASKGGGSMGSAGSAGAGIASSIQAPSLSEVTVSEQVISGGSASGGSSVIKFESEDNDELGAAVATVLNRRTKDGLDG